MLPESRTVEIDGVTVHYVEAGEPGGPLILLMHGFGASTFSWREVIEPLAAYGHVVAYDRPAFGLTERPLPGDWEAGSVSPYSEQANIGYVLGLMDHFGAQQAILVGNSAGGRVALAVAAAHPERVRALVLVDAAANGMEWNSLERAFFLSPQLRAVGPYAVRGIAGSGDASIRLAWHDPALVTEAIIAGYRLPLQVENWDRALWEFQRAGERRDLTDDLRQMDIPALVLSGDDDRIIPVEQAIALDALLPDSQLVIIENCGHLPHEEKPAEFMQAVAAFLSGLD
jgi:pimeloyl-ACP methyl ester carboxylesterase